MAPRSRTLLLHICCVCIYVLYELGYLQVSGSKFNWGVMVVFFLYNIIFFYLTSFWFLPVMRKHVHSVALKVVLAAANILAYTMISLLLTSALVFLYTGEYQIKTTTFYLYQVVSRGALFFSYAFAYWYARYSIKKVKEATEQQLLRAAAEQRETELENAYLRARINPHFLTNALNAIYSRLLEKAPGEAASVLMLAETMQYSFAFSSKAAKVTLSEEVQHIQRVIAMYQLMHKNRLNISLDVDIPVSGQKMVLPPMIFIDFVENIFKHGDLNDPTIPARIAISQQGNLIHFHSENLVAQQDSVNSHHTGLEHSERRLSKLFPGSHKLVITSAEGLFIVDLTLQL